MNVSQNKVSFIPTPEQDAAIKNEGGALLVSAAAGSGKTKVLVERLMRHISNAENPCDIDDFLIITYTNAAAAELRGKILDAIAKKIQEEPENRHLRRQSNLCYKAQISTIHGFCTKVLRENAHILDITPDFRVAEEGECLLIKQNVLNDILEKRYEDITVDSAFSLLVDTMAAGRDDKKIIALVLETHNKLQSHPYPAKWIEEQKKQTELLNCGDVIKTPWGALISKKAKTTAEYWLKKLENIVCENSDSDFMGAYGESLAVTVSDIKKFISKLDKSWDEAHKAAEIEFPKAKAIKGFDDLKDVRTRARNELAKVKKTFDSTSEELLSDMRAVAPAVSELLRLVMEFDAAYAAEKKKRGIVDFSDQEHMAVRLLSDSETGFPTDAAKEISKRYREIMVDEYQDVNAVQELIFNAVSQDGKNIFMVGDVKQSIYRFRLADPQIFLEKYRAFADYTEAKDGEGRTVTLSKNFRSRAGILEAANFIFKNVMSEELGEMEYTPREYLYPGLSASENPEPETELNVLDLTSDNEEEESREKTVAEAEFTAQRILRLVGSTKVSDGKGGLRAARFGDIAILLRSLKNSAEVYAEELAEKGIPVTTEKGENFFESLEVSVMISLLTVIDNPLQDVPLISVMRSPIYNFTPDELAEIRSYDKKSDFYTALSMAAAEKERFKAFVDEIDEYRSLAPDMSSDELIWYIYSKTGMLGIFGAMHGGSVRQDNLTAFFEYAGKYEKSGYKGLYSFITHLRKLRDEGKSLPVAVGGTDENAVKIMSIHKSKGLEFPIVILGSTTREFNKMDMQKPLLIHTHLGVGAKRLDLEHRIEYSTVARNAIALKLLEETLAEELRVLYVALTRAKDKLIINATYKNAEKSISKLVKDASLPISPKVLASSSCMADWILLPALTRPESEPIRFAAPVIPAEDDGFVWDVRLVKYGELTGEKADEEECEGDAEFSEDELAELSEKLNFEYPFSAAETLPSKITATELKGRFFDQEAAEEAESVSAVYKNNVFRRPNFVVEKEGLSGAERGTAVHRVMQFIDYAKCGDRETVAEEIERLKETHLIDEREAAAVNPHKILAFFRSDLGKKTLNAKKLYREFKFSLLIPANNLLKDAPEEEILLQGVIDCCVVEDDGLTIIDYKTDYVNKETVEERAKSYQMQIDTYAMAMQRITGLPIKGKFLYFFCINEAIAMK